MKKLFFVMTVLAAVLIGFTGCNQPGNPKAVVEQKDLYGSYWGALQFAGNPFKMCIVLKADKVEMHSNAMGPSYEVVTYTDKGNGIWIVGCYKPGEDTSKPSTHVEITVNTKDTPFSCKPKIIPMNNAEGFCKKGKDYNNEYKF